MNCELAEVKLNPRAPALCYRQRSCRKEAPVAPKKQIRRVTLQEPCQCRPPIETAVLLQQNINNLVGTLHEIMRICGIAEEKLDVNSRKICLKALMYYNMAEDGKTPRLRKYNIFHALGRLKHFSSSEIDMIYKIIKYGFYAFYYKIPQPDDYSAKLHGKLTDECVYVQAAKETANYYAQIKGMSGREQHIYHCLIDATYRGFYSLLKHKRKQQQTKPCVCCRCAADHEDLDMAKKLPCLKPIISERMCPKCCRKKAQRKVIYMKEPPKLCKKCQHVLQNCICPKYVFSLPCVESIWLRADFREYCTVQIDMYNVVWERRDRCPASSEASAKELPVNNNEIEIFDSSDF